MRIIGKIILMFFFLTACGGGGDGGDDSGDNIQPTATTNAIMLAANDPGLHCMDNEFSVLISNRSALSIVGIENFILGIQL